MADKVFKIWTDESLRKEVVNRGCERIKILTLENYAKQLDEIIKAAYKKNEFQQEG